MGRFLKEGLGKRAWLWLAIILLGFVILIAPSPFSNAQPQPSQDTVYLLTIDNEIISPVTADYIKKGISEANANGAKALIITLNTPGGLLSSTHTIVRNTLNAPLPIIVYVSPVGAQAGSAGVFIAMASHVAAMAPYTRIGETGSVNIATPSDSSHSEMSQHILANTTVRIRAIASIRNRNEDWAIKAVSDGVSVMADDALKNRLVDLVVPNIASLVDEINGKTVNIQGETKTIRLKNPQIVRYEFTLLQKALNTLAHPILAYLLLMVGFYGLLFEVTHPRSGTAGIIGGISLLLALVGLQALPVNMVGLGLTILGLLLFVAEVFAPTFGALFAGGLIALILGAFLIYQTDEPYLRQVVPYIVGTTVILSLLVGFLLWKVMKIKINVPYEKLIGQFGKVVMPIAPGSTGKVQVLGEVWDAESEEHLEPGMEIQVVSVNSVKGKILNVARFVREVI